MPRLSNFADLDQQIIQQRASRNKNSVSHYNISPIYSDESDIDLSDDDPTIDFNSIPRKHIRRQNFLFEGSTSDSSDFNSETNNSRRGRKRSRKIEKWQQVRSKQLRNRGKAYVSMSKRRKTIPARFIKDACNENCKLKCKDKIDDEGRYHLFSSFWDLGNLVAQRAYLRTCMEDITPKYKYTNSQNPRRPNKAFYFILNDNIIRVCKTFFLKYTVYIRKNDLHGAI